MSLRLRLLLDPGAAVHPRPRRRRRRHLRGAAELAAPGRRQAARGHRARCAERAARSASRRWRTTGWRYGQQDAFPAGTYGELVDASGVTTEAGYLLRRNRGSELVIAPGVSCRHRQDAGSTLTVPGEGSWESYRVLVSAQRSRSFRVTRQSTVVVAVPLDGVNTTLSTLLLFEIAISSGITIIVLVVTWLLVRRGMRPLERMGATARSIAASGLGRRVSPSNERTEVGQPRARAQRHARPDRASVRASAMSPSRSCVTSSRTPRTSCARRSRRCAATRSCCSATPT